MQNEIKPLVSGADTLRLNIGCGRFKIEGFTNIDINPIYKPDQCIDCLEYLRQQKTKTVKDIYCGHVIEHLDYPYLHDFLKECHRVLTQTGTLAITVPDAELAIREYHAGKITPGQFDLIIFGDRSSVHEYHKTAWTKRRLQEIAAMYGFRIADFPEMFDWLTVPVQWQRCAVMKKL